MNKIKVMICDDMQFVSQCFEILIKQSEDIEFVCSVDSGEALFEELKKGIPDIILLDIQLNYADEGVDILSRIKKEYPSIKVIMISVHEENDYIFRCFALGASDYIIKSDDMMTILDTIRNAYHDRLSLNPYISKKIVETCSQMQRMHINTLNLLNCIALLTASEYKILQAIYRGYSYADIAKQRFVEEVTIRTQVSKILKKFNQHKMSNLINDLKEINFFDFKIPPLE